MVSLSSITIQRGLISLVLFSIILASAYSVLAEDSTTSSTTRRDKVQERVETRKEKLGTRVEAVKQRADDRVMAMKEKIASREAALKLRLDAFKDKRKATLAERINTNLNAINSKITAQMLKHLERMTEILAKLEARVNSGRPDIKDPTSAKQAIADARAAIATATTAVNEQSQKDYTITVTSEATVRADAQKMREQLHNDLQAVRQKVIAAKQALANAIRVAKSSSNTPKEATTSGL